MNDTCTPGTMTLGLSLSQYIQREGAPTLQFSFLASRPRLVLHVTLIRHKRHGIVLVSSFQRDQDHVSQTTLPLVVLLLGGVVGRLQQYFCQTSPPFCGMFRFNGCRNRMTLLPGCPIDHHEEYYFGRCR